MIDKIYIRDLSVECIIGTKPHERENKQTVVINLVLDCDLAPAGETDELDDTVNYKTIKDAIAAFVEESQFFLLEKLARQIANICFEDQQVLGVSVAIDKPGALTGARSVAVEIHRERQ